MAQHNETGIRGEQLAREFLLKKNYQILETNWRHEKEEVDIIAMDERELVIVEVKTRSTDYFGNPEEAVSEAKEQRLIAAATIRRLSVGVRSMRRKPQQVNFSELCWRSRG